MTKSLEEKVEKAGLLQRIADGLTNLYLTLVAREVLREDIYDPYHERNPPFITLGLSQEQERYTPRRDSY